MKELSPEEAYQLMQTDSEVIYLDVRSVPEFESGHPQGAINIPIMHFGTGVGMYSNDDFSAVAEANLPRDAKLVIGCKTGMRSARACEVLNQMGYMNVANVRGGFVGLMDNSGRMLEPGWSMLNLPTSTDADERKRYESLATKAKK